jgi:Fe-S-cluster containining protein
MLDGGAIPFGARGKQATARVPVCERCKERCCVHKEPESGILLSLRDVAHLVDSGLSHLIVGKFVFHRDSRGRITGDVEDMPRLAKQRSGNCHFYEEKSGKCTGYGYRPTICRRFPFEVGFRAATGKPFAQFIPWAPCPTVRVPVDSAPVRQMIRDAAEDENLEYEDVILLPERIEELRRAGFGPYLPPPEECPGGRAGASARSGKGNGKPRSRP